MPESKYIVIKRADFEAHLAELQDIHEANGVDALLYLKENAVPDAEVIRHQDITAAPIFFHYSQQLHTLVDMADAIGMPLESTPRLMAIAEHFAAAAVAAQDHPNRKLPD